MCSAAWEESHPPGCNLWAQMPKWLTIAEVLNCKHLVILLMAVRIYFGLTLWILRLTRLRMITKPHLTTSGEQESGMIYPRLCFSALFFLEQCCIYKKAVLNDTIYDVCV